MLEGDGETQLLSAPSLWVSQAIWARSTSNAVLNITKSRRCRHIRCFPGTFRRGSWPSISVTEYRQAGLLVIGEAVVDELVTVLPLGVEGFL